MVYLRQSINPFSNLSLDYRLIPDCLGLMETAAAEGGERGREERAEEQTGGREEGRKRSRVGVRWVSQRGWRGSGKYMVVVVVIAIISS